MQAARPSSSPIACRPSSRRRPGRGAGTAIAEQGSHRDDSARRLARSVATQQAGIESVHIPFGGTVSVRLIVAARGTHEGCSSDEQTRQPQHGGGRCGAGAGESARPAAQTADCLRLDWVFQGPTSPFLVALEKGYYKAEGPDVTMDPGQGSAGAVQRQAPPPALYQIGFRRT